MKINTVSPLWWFPHRGLPTDHKKLETNTMPPGCLHGDRGHRKYGSLTSYPLVASTVVLQRGLPKVIEYTYTNTMSPYIAQELSMTTITLFFNHA